MKPDPLIAAWREALADAERDIHERLTEAFRRITTCQRCGRDLLLGEVAPLCADCEMGSE